MEQELKNQLVFFDLIPEKRVQNNVNHNQSSHAQAGSGLEKNCRLHFSHVLNVNEDDLNLFFKKVKNNNNAIGESKNNVIIEESKNNDLDSIKTDLIAEFDVCCVLRQSIMKKNLLGSSTMIIAEKNLPETLEAGGLLIIENKLSYFSNEDKTALSKSKFSKKFTEVVIRRFSNYFIPFVSAQFLKNSTLDFDDNSLPPIYIIFLSNGRDPLNLAKKFEDLPPQDCTEAKKFFTNTFPQLTLLNRPEFENRVEALWEKIGYAFCHTSLENMDNLAKAKDRAKLLDAEQQILLLKKQIENMEKEKKKKLLRKSTKIKKK